MVFHLVGGPRSGELVDDLPTGYSSPDTRTPDGDDMIADIPVSRAVWGRIRRNSAEASPGGIVGD